MFSKFMKLKKSKNLAKDNNRCKVNNSSQINIYKCKIKDRLGKIQI